MAASFEEAIVQIRNADFFACLNVAEGNQFDHMIGIWECCLSIWSTAMVCLALHGIQCGAFVVQELQSGCCKIILVDSLSVQGHRIRLTFLHIGIAAINEIVQCCFAVFCQVQRGCIFHPIGKSGRANALAILTNQREQTLKRFRTKELDRKLI